MENRTIIQKETIRKRVAENQEPELRTNEKIGISRQILSEWEVHRFQ